MVDSLFISKVLSEVGLILTLGIFLVLTLKHNRADVSRFSTFKFGVSVAVLVWLAGEFFATYDMGQLGTILHSVAMVIFPIVFLVKAKTFFKK